MDFVLFTEGVKCICNQLSLTTKIDAEHPELRSYAQSQGWWTGEDEFNFSEVFSPADDHLTCCSGRDTLEKQEGELGCSLQFSLSYHLSCSYFRDLVWPWENKQRGEVENRPCPVYGNWLVLKSLLCSHMNTTCIYFYMMLFYPWTFPAPISPLNADVTMLAFETLSAALLIPQHLYIWRIFSVYLPVSLACWVLTSGVLSFIHLRIPLWCLLWPFVPWTLVESNCWIPFMSPLFPTLYWLSQHPFLSKCGDW